MTKKNTPKPTPSLTDTLPGWDLALEPTADGEMGFVFYPPPAERPTNPSRLVLAVGQKVKAIRQIKDPGGWITAEPGHMGRCVNLDPAASGPTVTFETGYTIDVVPDDVVALDASEDPPPVRPAVAPIALDPKLIRYLDPGVRRLVVFLNEQGFATCDSGDGVSKPPVGRVLDVPHVFMVVDEGRSGEVEAWRLREVLTAVGVTVKPAQIQYSFDPVDGSRLLQLLHVSDTDLP